jgi:DNA-binding GntR family transcriptional regulator
MDLKVLEKEAQQSIRQWVYSVLRSNIIKLHLKPGTAISEAEIAETLNISRTPVREAFIILVEDGLLQIYPQKGSFVSLIDIDQAEEACFVRRVLGKAILKEACQNFPEDSLFDLSANLAMQKFCKKENNYERMYQLDNEFHQIIYRGCGKERTWLHIKKMNYNFDRLRIIRLSSGLSWDKIIHEHEQLGELIREKKPTHIDDVIKQHLPKACVGDISNQPPEYFIQSILEYVE